MPFLSSLANPLGICPCFLVPLFRDPLTTNAVLVQRISTSDSVVAFDPIYVDDASTQLQSELPIVTLEIGQSAIWAFAHSDGRLSIGTSEQIRPALLAALHGDETGNSILLQVEIAKFCRKSDSYYKLLCDAFSFLGEISEVGAELWRDTVVLLAAVREEVASQLLAPSAGVAGSAPRAPLPLPASRILCGSLECHWRRPRGKGWLFRRVKIMAPLLSVEVAE